MAQADGSLGLESRKYRTEFCFKLKGRVHRRLRTHFCTELGFLLRRTDRAFSNVSCDVREVYSGRMCAGHAPVAAEAWDPHHCLPQPLPLWPLFCPSNRFIPFHTHGCHLLASALCETVHPSQPALTSNSVPSETLHGFSSSPSLQPVLFSS